MEMKPSNTAGGRIWYSHLGGLYSSAFLKLQQNPKDKLLMKGDLYGLKVLEVHSPR